MQRPLSTVRDLLVTRSQLDLYGVWPGLHESSCCPALPHAPHRACLDLLPMSTPCFLHTELLKAPNSSTSHPCRVFAPNFLSVWNILTSLPSSNPTPLFTLSWQCPDANASSSQNPECFGFLQHFVLTCHTTVRCILYLSSLPTNSGLLSGRDLCCSLPYPQLLTHGLAHSKCSCRLVR